MYHTEISAVGHWSHGRAYTKVPGSATKAPAGRADMAQRQPATRVRVISWRYSRWRIHTSAGVDIALTERTALALLRHSLPAHAGRNRRRFPTHQEHSGTCGKFEVPAVQLFCCSLLRQPRLLVVQAETATFLHVIGNHCLTVPRKRLMDELKMPSSYYSRELPGKWRLIVLDTTEMSGHSQYSEASPLICIQAYDASTVSC